MQEAGQGRRRRRNALLFLTALLVVVGDQLTKVWIRTYPEGHPVFELGFFRIVRGHNTGAVFGLFQGHKLIYVLIVYRRFPSLDSLLNRVALGLILGGTVGNLIDRISRGSMGVTDFISIGPWPTFNIADSGVTIGTILFAYSLMRSMETEKHEHG
jgi:signal peptidase II